MILAIGVSIFHPYSFNLCLDTHCTTVSLESMVLTPLKSTASCPCQVQPQPKRLITALLPPYRSRQSNIYCYMACQTWHLLPSKKLTTCKIHAQMGSQIWIYINLPAARLAAVNDQAGQLS